MHGKLRTQEGKIICPSGGLWDSEISRGKPRRGGLYCGSYTGTDLLCHRLSLQVWKFQEWESSFEHSSSFSRLLGSPRKGSQGLS